MAENSPNLMKCINLHIQEVQQTSSKQNSKRSTPRYYNRTVKRQRENLGSSTREATHHVKGSSIRLTALFSPKVMEAKRQSRGIFKMLKDKKFSTKYLICNKITL